MDRCSPVDAALEYNDPPIFRGLACRYNVECLSMNYHQPPGQIGIGSECTEYLPMVSTRLKMRIVVDDEVQ